MLNSNDFDFLQSRGANSVDSEDDRRSSLLLRFDPLARLSILKTQLKQPVQTIEETDTDSEKTLTPSASSDRNVADDNHTSNEPPSNGNLVEVTHTMDNDTNGYMNNVR